MNKLKLLAAVLLFSSIGCSEDEDNQINEPANPSTPSGQMLLSAVVQPTTWGWTNNHVRIRRLRADGYWEFISLPPVNGIERSNQAYVNAGDKIKIVYDIGVDQNQCCLLYELKQGHTVKRTDSRCASNTEPFFTYFEFEIE